MSESNHEQDDRARARGRPTQTISAEEPPADYSHRPLEPKRVQPHSSATSIDNRFANRFKAGNWADHTSTLSGTKRLALVISISYGIRKPPPKLSGTYTDAYNIINLLTNQFGYLENEICVLADLIDKSGEKDESRWPSRTNIIRALEWLNHDSKDGDQRFLFFAGHGYRRVENKSGFTYEGIMPADIEFTPYETCVGCTCGLQSQTSGFITEEDEYVVPYPKLIIWDYTLNQILARSLADGANLTVVFDCCHSGGTLKKSFTGGIDVMTRPTARGNTFSFSSSSSGESNQTGLYGNFLRLPAHLPNLSNDPGRISTETEPRGDLSTLNVCEPHLDAKPDILEFRPNCRVVCWAACSDIQRAFELTSGGRFTNAFVDHLRDNQNTNYRLLNRSIFQKFEEYNKSKKVNDWNYQLPQLYTSTKMVVSLEGSENHFEHVVEI